VREVSGSVALDAGYATQHGASIIASNGASALQLGDASLIANNGPNLILPDGNTIISQNGGGIISENGAGIIAHNGAGLTGKVKRGLLAAAATGSFGAVLPTAGLAVGVVDLASGKLLKLGEDAHGNPAYGVVTDATGAFHLYLPADLTKAVRVVGLPRDGGDARLETNLLTSKLDGALALDEDSQAVATNMRLQLGKAILHMFDPPPGETAVDDVVLSLAEPGIQEAFDQAQQRLAGVFKAADGAGLDADTKLAIALRLTDIELSEMPSAATQPVPIKGAQRPAVPGMIVDDMVGVLRQLREQVGTVMEAERQAGRDPAAYFAAKPYLRDLDPPFPIRKPADLDDFVIRGVLANPAYDSLSGGLQLATVFADKDYDIGATALDTFLRANAGLYIGSIRSSFIDHPAVLPAMEAELTRLVKLAKASPG